MDNVKNDKYYAQLIIDNIKVIQKYLGNKTYDEFLNDEQLIDAVMSLKKRTIIFLGAKLWALGTELFMNMVKKITQSYMKQ